MATSKLPDAHSWSALANVDLSGKLHYLAKIGTNGKIDLCGAGGVCIGNLYEVAEADRSVSVQFGGIGKVIAGATIVAGDRIMSDSAGKATPATAGNWGVGVALTGASAGGIISFMHLNSLR